MFPLSLPLKFETVSPMEIEILTEHFPQLTEKQLQQFSQLPALYTEWNDKINVVSRKDLENLMERHVLHSLSIAKFFRFLPSSKVMDLGTGGGFPGIPLAIFFPEVDFHLVDSIGKKIKVVDEVAAALHLKNVKAEQLRGEKAPKGQYDFVVSRAVTTIETLFHWTKPLLSKSAKHSFKNGLICLKGGDLREEFSNFRHVTKMYDLKGVFSQPFFETKKVVYVS